MNPVAIEINDIGLRASTAAGPFGMPSPGFAWLDGGGIVTGEPARRTARLKPRFVSDRHWDRMNLESVGRPFPAALRQADLVHTHLEHYWAELTAALEIAPTGPAVLLAVPSSYSRQQLGLLLGIARSVEIPVTGLVDTALSATTGTDREGHILHIDVLLHRTVLTLVEADGQNEGHRRRNAASQVEDAGLVTFQRRWMDRLARRFVRETRFDPLHRGDSEQALYDRLPQWAREIATRGSAVVTLDSEHSIEVDAPDMVAAAREPIEAIVRSALALTSSGTSAGTSEGTSAVPVSPALSSRAAILPGLAERVAETWDREPLLLPDDAAAAGALRCREAIESPGRELPLVLELRSPPRVVSDV